jgi:hypothetical protein
MAHVSLDDPQVDSGFEKMSGIGVAEGVNGDTLFVDSSSDLGPTEDPLDTAFGHGRGSVLCSSAVSAKSREEKARVAVDSPIAAEQIEGGWGERDIAILSTLSTVNVDHHTAGVDIRDFEMETFVEPQAAGVDGGEIGIIVEGFHLGQNGSDFIDAENSREASFGLGSEDSEDVPVSLEDMLIEESYSAIADAHGIGWPLINVLSVEEIVLEFLLSDQIGGFAIELGEHANGAGVGLLSPFSFAIELKSLDRSVIPLCLHDTSPFSYRGITPSVEEGFGGIILDRVVCCLSNRLLKRVFRKAYKSRNLPRSGLLEPIRIETTWKVVSIRCSRSP